MSQDTETTPWVIITVFEDGVDPNELQRVVPQIQTLIDEWQGKGKMVWSGAFNDNATGMAVFEGTKDEANEFYGKYDKICAGLLRHSLYQWDAMPILFVLSK